MRQKNSLFHQSECFGPQYVKVCTTVLSALYCSFPLSGLPVRPLEKNQRTGRNLNGSLPKGSFLYTILYNYTKMRYANLYNLKILRIFSPER
jgi:hypothetical protein